MTIAVIGGAEKGRDPVRWAGGLPGERVVLVGALALAALVLCLHARWYDFVSDDTFIGLRYARNLLEGKGLTYNAGERVEGYTNLLWILLISAMGAGGVDLLFASRLLSLAAGLATLVAAAYIARRLAPENPWLAGVPPLLIACNAPFACWGLAGMEAPGFALGIAASILLYLHPGDRPMRLLSAGAAAGATALVRPEGVLLGLVLCGIEAARPATPGRWRRTATLAAPFALVMVTQLWWRMQYYGEWLPNTYYAKVGSGSLALAARGLGYLADYTRNLGGPVLYVLPLVAGLWRRDRAWWTLAAVLVAQTAAVAYVGGDGLPMYRFIAPLVPLWVLLLVALAGDVPRRAGAPRSLAAVAAIALGVVAVCGAVPPVWSGQYLLYKGQKEYEIPAWTAAGKWLQQHASPGDSVACVPIGAIGYYSRLKVYDMLGLTDAHIARIDAPTGRGWAGHEKHDGAYVLAQGPTYLLLGNVRILNRRLPLDHPAFVRVNNPSVEAREGDIYLPELARHYEPAIAELPGGLFLHYLRRRGP